MRVTAVGLVVGDPPARQPARVDSYLGLTDLDLATVRQWLATQVKTY
ncbi:hypothetical protein [Micromonospora carbonacea]|nr:hypothetical protein [Micromonospora carbonacea]